MNVRGENTILHTLGPYFKSTKELLSNKSAESSINIKAIHFLLKKNMFVFIYLQEFILLSNGMNLYFFFNIYLGIFNVLEFYLFIVRYSFQQINK